MAPAEQLYTAYLEEATAEAEEADGLARDDTVPPIVAQRVDALPKPTDYISDFAHVLSPEAIARLDRICDQLDHYQTNAQVAVVTVQTLDGDDAADYANQLEDKWKMGRKGSDRGVLVLLAVGDHQRRIDVGYGL